MLMEWKRWKRYLTLCIIVALLFATFFHISKNEKKYRRLVLVVKEREWEWSSLEAVCTHAYLKSSTQWSGKWKTPKKHGWNFYLSCFWVKIEKSMVPRAICSKTLIRKYDTQNFPTKEWKIEILSMDEKILSMDNIFIC